MIEGRSLSLSIGGEPMVEGEVREPMIEGTQLISNEVIV